jgi:uncharacterized membrane protein YccC
MMPILNGRLCISMRRERVRASGASDEQLNALGYLLNNLRAIDAQLATIESVQTTAPAGSNTETLWPTTDSAG